VLKNKGRNKTFNWYVSNPINNYGVNINIGITFPSRKIQREKGDLDCNYYVERQFGESQEQFKDVPRMLKALSTGLDLIRFEDSFW
jgi:hypothetical protein